MRTGALRGALSGTPTTKEGTKAMTVYRLIWAIALLLGIAYALTL